MTNDYYTYAYLRKDRTPYYIGKGKGGRVHCTQRTSKPPKDKSLIIFLKKNLTEIEAFKHEIYMIAVLGRKDLGTGILRNQTNGGDGASGSVRSKETKKRYSESKTGEKNPQYGVPRTEEVKRKLSKAIIAVKPDGTELHFGSVNEAARELGIHSGNLSSLYLKTSRSPKWGKFKGWKFIYKDAQGFKG